MDKLVKRIVNIVVLVLAVIGTVSGLYFALGVASKYPATADLLAVGEKSTSLAISFSIMYILFFAILAMVAFFVILQVFSSKKSLIRVLILLAGAAIIALFSYMIAPSDLSDVAMRVGVSESVYRWTGAGLNIMYIVFAGVILTFLGTLVYIKIKK